MTNVRGLGRQMGRCLALMFVCLAAVAQACPSCTGRDGGGTTRLVLIGAMILLPLVVAGVAALTIARQLRAENGE